MTNKKILYWTLQFFGWLLYYCLVGMNLYSNNRLNNKAITLLISTYLASIITTHLLRLYFIKREYINLKIQQMIPRVILASIIGGIILKAFQSLLDRGIIHFNQKAFSWNESILDALGITFIFFLWCVFYFAYQYFAKSRREEIKNLQWEALQNQIELNNLKSQLNPHFMFNSLNSIRALIDIDKKDAKESITKLSTLLRTSLLMGKKNVVSIEEEIDLVKSYLDLEKIRFEERLQVDLQISEEVLEVEIPPLMIQTLVENSIKHGISKKMEGGTISVIAKIENGDCLIRIKNPGKIENEINDNGSIGIKNTKDRLRLMFDNRASFDLRQEGDFVIGIVKIKHI